ncbi:MAG: FecR family protein [Rubricoccaceae bacterium]
MRDALETLALYDVLPPEEREAIAVALAAQPDLAEAFRRWTALRAHVRAELDRALPDPELLVLAALGDFALPENAEGPAREPAGSAPGTPASDALSPAEHEALEAAREGLLEAIARHPSVGDAIRRLRADAAAFEQAWIAHAADAIAVPEMPAGDGVPPADGASPVVAASPLRPLTAADRSPARPARAARRPVMRWAVRGVMLLAVVGFAALLVFLQRRDTGFETIRAAEARAISLPDGSAAELAPGAVLMVRREAGADARQARLLAGQVLFNVYHDPAQPFVLETPNAEVRVVGTTFSVAATDVQTDVVLLSGAVTLAPRARPAEAVRLAPGQQSRVLALDRPVPPAPADIGSALEWTGDVFARAEPAGRVAERLGARFGRPVSVAPDLRGEPVSGRFRAGDGLEPAVEALAQALGARAERAGNGFRLVLDEQP